jgi:hypothetical protein
MGPFGPFYPPRLQASVNHAERLVRVLETEEARTTDARHVSAWLIGRAGELERFVEAVARDWRSRKRGPEAAAAVLEAYVAELHVGLGARLGVTGPVCCRTDSVTTELPPEAKRKGEREEMEGETVAAKKLIDSIDRLLDNLGE